MIFAFCEKSGKLTLAKERETKNEIRINYLTKSVISSIRTIQLAQNH